MLMHERLKRAGKWVYLFLAVIFALSFVVAGVGTSGSISLSDFLQRKAQDRGGDASTGSTQPNEVKDALAATKARPKDPAAWLDLADVYVTSNQTDKAAEAAATASALAPTDAAVQERVAGIWESRAQALQGIYQALLSRYSAISQAQSDLSNVGPGGADSEDPFTKAQSAQLGLQLDAIASVQGRCLEGFNVMTVMHQMGRTIPWLELLSDKLGLDPTNYLGVSVPYSGSEVAMARLNLDGYETHDDHDPRPHPSAILQRLRRLVRDPRDRRCGFDSGDRQWRYLVRRHRARCARCIWRLRRDGRPRGAGASVARGQYREGAGRRGRGAPYSAEERHRRKPRRALRRFTLVLRRTTRPQGRAQAPRRQSLQPYRCL